jgi:uncharacterized membrane protein
MAVRNHVENPFEYVLERASWIAEDIRRSATTPPHLHAAGPLPRIQHISTADLWASLREGMHDLGVARSDVVFIALFYPIVGLVLARLAFSLALVPLILPLLSGFAILGPVAAVGLYEISRRLEADAPVNWSTPLQVFRSPAFSSILGLGAILALLFLAWLAVAWGIYAVTLGPGAPTSIGGFLHDVFTTPAGWAMTVLGTGVGFLFAAFAFSISVISFPLLLERDVGIGAAVRASWEALRKNPGPMAIWGLVIATLLIAGSIPALAGLIFVMPLLGHASWRLYRRVTTDVP